MPSSLHKISAEDRTPNPEWISHVGAKAQKLAPGVSIIPAGSPFTYQAKNGGVFYILFGGVSDVSLARGLPGTRQYFKFSTGQTNGIFPVERSDYIIITYTTPPTIVFLPSSI